MIYFVASHDSAFVKIGFSKKNASERLDEISSQQPLPTIRLATFWADRTVEGALHRKFQHLRTHREWFHHDQEIGLWLRANKGQVLQLDHLNAYELSYWAAERASRLKDDAFDIAGRRARAHHSQIVIARRFQTNAIARLSFNMAMAVAASIGPDRAHDYCATVIAIASALDLMQDTSPSVAKAAADEFLYVVLKHKAVLRNGG